MSVITISRGSFSYGQEVAERTARRLGYDCVSREILVAASKEFNIPGIKLFQAIHDAPSFLDRVFQRKARYIAYIQAAVLKSLKKDNIVYHGFAGHFFVKDVPHVLKVRIIANIEERIRIVVEKNQLSYDAAALYIQRMDEQRRKWGLQLYGVETSDPSLYDLVLHIDQITAEDAVDIICHKVGLRSFQTTQESRQQIEDLWLAAEARAALIDLKPDIEVIARQGSGRVAVCASLA